MADVSIIVDKNGTEFTIADAPARADIAEIQAALPDGASASDKLVLASQLAAETDRATAAENALTTQIGGFGKSAASLFNSNMLAEVTAAANRAPNYNAFYGGTREGSEGAWYGFKHVAGIWSALLVNKYGVAFYSVSGGVTTLKKITQ